MSQPHSNAVGLQSSQSGMGQEGKCSRREVAPKIDRSDSIMSSIVLSENFRKKAPRGAVGLKIQIL